MKKINKKFHFVWVGDEKKCPHNCIDTWRVNYPDWEVKIWGDDEWQNREWINKRHMDEVAKTGQLCGVADLMRWEILLNEGGVALDADAVSLMPMPDWMLDCELFAAWDNEIAKPGLITNTLVGAQVNNPVIRHIVEILHQEKSLAKKFVWKKLKYKNRDAWKTTGPVALTKAIQAKKYTNATILPSHFFVPFHHFGYCYNGGGAIYSANLFAETKGTSNVFEGLFDGYHSLKDVPSDLLIRSIRDMLAGNDL